MELKPVFEHDSTCCRFLGSGIIGEKVFDFYYCAGEPTILARFSSEGADYASGMCFGKTGLSRALFGENFNKALTVAYVLAMANGLDVVDKHANLKTALDVIRENLRIEAMREARERKNAEESGL